MITDIKNSAGKILGYTNYDDNQFTVDRYGKPILVLDPDISKAIVNETKSDDISRSPTILKLYDDYTLSIAEIAALYGTSYYIMNNIIKHIGVTSPKAAGRRNSSYGIQFSEERRKHLSESHAGQVPVGYIRTDEIKEKISKTLKEKYASGELIQDPAKKSKAWADGKYDYSPMGTGVQGYFHSNKSPKVSYFRSSFELYYMIKLDNDKNVSSFESEPFKIPISDQSIYIPDLLVNRKILVELKKEDPDVVLSKTGQYKKIREMA